MRFYKLRVTTNAASIATTFNEQFKPEIIPEVNDPYHVDWIYTSDEPYLVGDAALRLANPEEMGYAVRWPIYGGDFNTRDYPSAQLILSDIETIFRESLKSKGIEPSAHKVGGVSLTSIHAHHSCPGPLCSSGHSRLLRSSLRGIARQDPADRYGLQTDLRAASTDVCVMTTSTF